MIAPKITVNGSGAITAAASATIAIPNDVSGARAKRVMVTVEGATFVLPGASTAVATDASTIVNPGSPLLLDVYGVTHIAHLELTAAQRIVVTPLEGS